KSPNSNLSKPYRKISPNSQRISKNEKDDKMVGGMWMGRKNGEK
ncbi:11654_t:CDS:1, partial [Entrophospora sp. SA101]